MHVFLLSICHNVFRFLQGTWTAEVRVPGGVGDGSGFLVMTLPTQGSIIGRYFENVTDSIDVKAQFAFQVEFVVDASHIRSLRVDVCCADWYDRRAGRKCTAPCRAHCSAGS